jgi:sugar/nucleoside kinase (ribokinase family)
MARSRGLPASITCVGHLGIDVTRVEDATTAAFGGAAFHFAVTAAALGLAVDLVGRARLGRWVSVFDSLAAFGLDSRRVIDTDDTVFRIFYSKDLVFSHERFSIEFPAEMPSTVPAVARAIDDGPEFVHIAALQPPELREMIDLVRNRDVRFSLQTHMSQLVPGRKLLRNVANDAETVFLSQDEYEVLIGEAADGRFVPLLNTAPRWIVTSGETVWMIKDGVVSEFRMPQTTPVDPTGAGDSFAAAFTAAYALTSDANLAIRVAGLVTVAGVTGVSSNVMLRLLRIETDVPGG